jgi:hypothetical protein
MEHGEVVFVFLIVILQRIRDIKSTRDTRRKQIQWRLLEAWKDGKYDMLVQTAEHDMLTSLSTSRGGTTVDERLVILEQKTLNRDVHGMVKLLT